jgi:hypothetical protein
MYCPTCGQQQISDETRYCSRCGFLLTGIAKVVEFGGSIPGLEDANAVSSPRKRGLKQGFFILLLALLVVPILTMITIAIDAEPFAVVISLFLFGVGGVLRMVYALMFESSAPSVQQISGRSKNMEAASPHALNAGQPMRAADYAAPGSGSWRETNDLATPVGSVTDSTTKLLDKQHDHQ